MDWMPVAAVGEVHHSLALVGHGNASHMTISAFALLHAQQCCVEVHIIDLQLQAQLFSNGLGGVDVDALNSPASVVISYGGRQRWWPPVSLPASTVVSSAAALVEAASEEAALLAQWKKRCWRRNRRRQSERQRSDQRQPESCGD